MGRPLEAPPAGRHLSGNVLIRAPLARAAGIVPVRPRDVGSPRPAPVRSGRSMSRRPMTRQQLPDSRSGVSDAQGAVERSFDAADAFGYRRDRLPPP